MALLRSQTSRQSTTRKDRSPVAIEQIGLGGETDASDASALNVETIGLYQVHAWDPLTRLEETLRFLDDAVRAGKINYVGPAVVPVSCSWTRRRRSARDRRSC